MNRKKYRRPLARMAVTALTALLAFAHAARPQCATKPDPQPPYKYPIGPTGQRICCSLGAQSGIDPENLRGHTYGNQTSYMAQTEGKLPGKEPNGYIYTAAAGLVDTGHVRDNADAVFYVYMQFLNGQHTIYLNNDAIGVANIPATQAQQVGLAGAIVWANAWRHELTTWGYTTMHNNETVEDFSAFSPEDLSSNIVGIEAATEAILNGNTTMPLNFNTQMDLVLARMMKALGAVSAKQTSDLLDQVQYYTELGKSDDAKKDLTGKWFFRDLHSPGNVLVRLLRRNFDGAVWKIPGAPLIDTPGWLTQADFSKYDSQFLYLADDKATVDATQVPETTNYALVKGFTPLVWAPTAMVENAANAAQPAGGTVTPPCLIAPKTRAPIPSGKYVTVELNVGQQQPQYFLWTFEDATRLIRSEFVRLNPNMDDPVKYVPPVKK